jgi:hypothetical protein
MPSSIRKSLWILTLAAGLVGGNSPLVYAQLTTEKDVQTHLEGEGYQQIRDIKFTPEGITARAMKDGQQVSLIIDSSGKVKKRN